MNVMSVRRAGVIVAMLAVSVSGAAAQERPSEFDNWTIPGWTFTPSISLSGLWDSNVSLAANQAEGKKTAADRMFTFEPQGQLDYRSARTEFTGGYRGYARRYMDVTGLNSIDHRGFFSLRHLATKHSSFFFQNEYADVPTTDEIELLGVPYVRAGSRSNRFATGYDARVSKYDDIGIRYEHTWVTFDQTTTAVLRGGTMNGVRAEYTRRLGERTQLGAQYRVRHSEMRGGRTAWFNDLGALLEHQLSPTVRLSFAGGYSTVQDSRLADRRGGLFVRTELVRELQRYSVGLYYERSYAPAFGFGGSSRNQDVRGYVHMPFSQNRLYVNSSAAWRRTEGVLSDDLSFDTIGIDNTLGYGLSRWLRLEVFHAYSRQDSRLTGGEINRHRAGTQIVVAQPMRIR